MICHTLLPLVDDVSYISTTGDDVQYIITTGHIEDVL